MTRPLSIGASSSSLVPIGRPSTSSCTVAVRSLLRDVGDLEEGPGDAGGGRLGGERGDRQIVADVVEHDVLRPDHRLLQRRVRRATVAEYQHPGRAIRRLQPAGQPERAVQVLDTPPGLERCRAPPPPPLGPGRRPPAPEVSARLPQPIRGWLRKRRPPSPVASSTALVQPTGHRHRARRVHYEHGVRAEHRLLEEEGPRQEQGEQGQDCELGEQQRGGAEPLPRHRRRHRVADLIPQIDTRDRSALPPAPQHVER